MTQVECKDFIAVFKNVCPEGYCSHVIKEFDRLVEEGCASNRRQADNVTTVKKDDLAIEMNWGAAEFNRFENQSTRKIFFDVLQRCFDAYSEQFSTLKEINIRAHSAKMQRTDRGGGYHMWHHEQGNDYSNARCLVYMLYCNTLPEEARGETEFLYQEQTLRPTENTLVIWPAAFTHVHRGNAVYGEHSKYIITGWFYLT